jgi:hypothetical protein
LACRNKPEVAIEPATPRADIGGPPQSRHPRHMLFWRTRHDSNVAVSPLTSAPRFRGFSGSQRRNPRPWKALDSPAGRNRLSLLRIVFWGRPCNPDVFLVGGSEYGPRVGSMRSFSIGDSREECRNCRERTHVLSLQKGRGFREALAGIEMLEQNGCIQPDEVSCDASLFC